MIVNRSKFIGFLLVFIIPVVLGAFEGIIRGNEQIVTLAAVGDVFFCRGIADEIEQNGLDYPFEFTHEILSSYDLAFCNVECTLSTRGEPGLNYYLFRADPSAANALSSAGFDVVNVANNHTLDYGFDALGDTVDAVTQAGMVAVGAHENGVDDTGVKMIEKDGLKIGFLALSDFDVTEGVHPDGCTDVMMVDPETIVQQVADADSQCDVLIVSLHWGVDYLEFYTHRQSAIAELCIDSGADLILGHHPHVLQYVETYRGKPIIYSMGGFVWDSSHNGADESAIFVFELGEDSAELVKTIPVRVVEGQPIPDAM
jgi:gamma-polyglutamate biosynthesis protein CapA